AVRSERAVDHSRRGAPQPRGLQPVRGPFGNRSGQEGVSARRPDRRRRQVARPRGRGQLRAARPGRSRVVPARTIVMGSGGKTSLASAIDGDRLWQRHMELARIGATARGGVNRQALTPEDGRARAKLLDWAAPRGFATSVDPIGNLFIRRPGRDAAAAPVVTGSHLDTQPTGGEVDGIYGVLAGVGAPEGVCELGLEPGLPIDLGVWTNEEGPRFPPTTMGSAVFAGVLPLDRALATRDATGVSVADALAAMLAAHPIDGRRP